ncbi:MAG: hypothetical protein Q9N34_08395 [Aquificota bacterium]|nr:hypothetical protein [Aquificota bacterium]
MEVLPQKTFREKVARLVEVLMGYALTSPDKFRYLTVYHILREELSQEDLPGRRILEIFKTAYREGDTDLIPEIALSIVIGSVDRIFILRELGLTNVPDRELVENLKNAVLKAVFITIFKARFISQLPNGRSIKNYRHG